MAEARGLASMLKERSGASADDLKQEANAAFASKDYKAASKLYSAALSKLQPHGGKYSVGCTCLCRAQGTLRVGMVLASEPPEAPPGAEEVALAIHRTGFPPDPRAPGTCDLLFDAEPPGQPEEQEEDGVSGALLALVPETAAGRQLQIVLHMNLAKCQLKQTYPGKGAARCSLAVALAYHHEFVSRPVDMGEAAASLQLLVKALLVRVQCLRGCGNRSKSAALDVEAALALHPSDPGQVAQLQKLERLLPIDAEKRRRSDRKLAKEISKMVAKSDFSASKDASLGDRQRGAAEALDELEF